jgi:hypothetical protein
LRPNLDIESGPNVTILFNTIIFSGITSWLNHTFDLILDGSVHWDETENHIVGTYTLSGIEPILRDILSATTTLFEDRGPLFDMLYSVNTVVKQ